MRSDLRINFVSSPPHKSTPSLLFSIFVKGTVIHPGLLNPHLQSTSNNILSLVSDGSFHPGQHGPGEDLYCNLPGWFKTVFESFCFRPKLFSFPWSNLTRNYFPKTQVWWIRKLCIKITTGEVQVSETLSSWKQDLHKHEIKTAS